ncbi:lysylphosphatidylglycerol synthase transmembrane domain-containing protein [Actinokineospora guangxiensis]|uniref:Lysylphosphatidylglycerol synthase transmembrane domain-containing protein n=1 Tax=Actinokineospora guangxiensis TaxID=1490288 RepID=A0ABW0EXI0_9PSEU
MNWWPAVRVLAGVAILAALVWRFGAGAFLDGLASVTPGAVVAALGIGVATTVVCALRWRLFAHRLGLPLGLPTAVADYYGSLAVNAVLPAGVLGDVHRAVSHGARVGALGRGVRAVVWERGIGQAVLVAVTAAVVVAHLVGTGPLPTVAGAAGGGAAGGGVADGSVVGGGAEVWGLLWGVVGVVVVLAVGVLVARKRRWVRVVVEDVRAMGWGLVVGAGLSVVAVVGYVGLFFVAAGAAGVGVAVGDSLVLAATALLVMAVPLSVGGWGPREAYLAAAFGVLGYDAADGVRTSVVYGVLALVSAAPGFVVLAVRLCGQRGQVRGEGGGEVAEDGRALARAAQ